MTNFYRLIQGDCLKVLPTLEDESIDLIVTSPPYPEARMWDVDKINKEDQKEILLNLSYKCLEECYRIIKKHAVIIWNIADIPNSNKGITLASAFISLYAKKLGLVLRGDIIWYKGVSLLTPLPFMRKPVIPNLTYEHLLIFFKGDWVPREKKSCLSKEENLWRNWSVWTIGTASAKKLKHIAPFPEELIKRCLSLWSFKDDVVLDPFLGSGTTMKVAQDLGRSCIGIEIEPKYCELVKNRCFCRQFLDREVEYKFEVFK